MPAQPTAANIYRTTNFNVDRPVQYPVACSPQFWANCSIFQLWQMMFNLVPDAPNNQLRIIESALPKSINKLSRYNLKICSTLLD
ncbi:hypothetical protein [Microcoleus sp.]|uniref:hypothetical protein n=1 Tax=Microcoleus sp. TaxID=44472 RepID=UPI0035933049